MEIELCMYFIEYDSAFFFLEQLIL